MKKQLIIVANDEYLKYATYLQGLISSLDDEEKEQIGTKDGAVSAVIWDEKHHKANSKSLTSSNSVVFFGNSDYTRNNCSEINTKFSKFGMSYGWLGNHANLCVTDNALNKDNASDFYQMAEEYGKRFENELLFLFSPKKGEQLRSKKDDQMIAATKPTFPLAHIVDIVLKKGKSLKLPGRIAMAIDKGFDKTKNSEAIDQQYTLLTLVFYLDGLSDFLDA